MTGASTQTPFAFHKLLRAGSLQDLLDTREPTALRLCKGHGAWGAPTYLWSDNLSQRHLDDDDDNVPLPAIDLVALPDVELRSDFMAYRGDQAICDSLLFPRYLASFYEVAIAEDYFAFPQVDDMRSIDEPVFCVSHLNMRTYGHFLLEVLPKLLLARELWRLGFRIRVAFPSDAPPVSAIVEMLLDGDQLLTYESESERLRAPIAIFPSLNGGPVQHGWIVSAIWQLSAALSLAQRPASTSGRRLFLSRQHVEGFRTLTNEAEAFSVAAGYGFELVHPQEHRWDDQVRMFFHAGHVIGMESSALHGAMFCPPQTSVIALGRVNGIQAAIAACFGHRVGYVMPIEGVIAEWSAGAERQTFRVDTGELKRRLDMIV
jgi:glycosyl transferase family 61